MAQKASKIHACVFVNTSYQKAFIFNTSGIPIDVDTSKLTDREASAYIAMQDAFNKAVGQYGAFQYENNLCPWDYSNNNAVVAEHGLFVLPAAVITADYPDGSKKQYVLGKEFIDKLTGGIWTAQKLYPYIKTLLLNTQPSENKQITILCKLIPPLCEVGGWVWFGLALGATMKANNSKSIGKGLWTTGAALLWYEWYQRGGFTQLKNTIGINSKRK